MYLRHSTPYSGLAGFFERQRLHILVRSVDKLPQDSLLEVGCESGMLLKEFHVERRVGFDISPKALEGARQRFAREGREVELIQGDANQPLPFQKGEFSVIVCSEVLEHFPDPRNCIRSIAGICDQDTRVLLTVPIERPKVIVKSFLKRLGLMKIFFPHIEEDQSEWHLQQFDRRLLLETCEGHLEVDSMKIIYGLHWLAVCRLAAGRAGPSDRCPSE